MLTHIRRRLMPQAVKVRADVEVGCCGYEGIDAVKAALRAGMALSTEELQVKVNLIAPPLYVLTTQTLEKEEGLKLIQSALNRIEETIKSFGGIFNVQQAVRAFFIDFCFVRSSSIFFFLSYSPKWSPTWTKPNWPSAWTNWNKKTLKCQAIRTKMRKATKKMKREARANRSPNRPNRKNELAIKFPIFVI